MPKSVRFHSLSGVARSSFTWPNPKKFLGLGGWGGARGIDRLVVGVEWLSFLAVSTNSKLIPSVLAYLLSANLLFLTACVC